MRDVIILTLGLSGELVSDFFRFDGASEIEAAIRRARYSRAKSGLLIGAGPTFAVGKRNGTCRAWRTHRGCLASRLEKSFDFRLAEPREHGRARDRRRHRRFHLGDVQPVPVLQYLSYKAITC